MKRESLNNCPGRAAARTSAFTRVFARYGDAVQTRDRYECHVWNGPGSAVERYAWLHAAPPPGQEI
jgi:hypothetical protein